MRLTLNLMVLHVRYLPLLFCCTACALPPNQLPQATISGVGREPATVGVLVMAHGGSQEWNESVLAATGPIREMLPTQVAFGMADPLTLADGLARLEAAGVERVAVVRMFLSGESFLEQTAYLLGLSEAPPHHFMLMGGAQHLGPKPEPVPRHSEIATHSEGIMRSPEAADIVSARALQLATNPHRESVLVIAHGMGDDAEDQRVVDAMQGAAIKIAAHGFAAVQVETLREDWPEKRDAAEGRIRDFVSGQSRLGRKVLVVPYRLSGFGPYTEVLEGLEYAAAEGLLPHPRLSDWISRTALEVICQQGWADAATTCASVPTSSSTIAR